jgi:hypothetical protein
LVVVASCLPGATWPAVAAAEPTEEPQPASGLPGAGAPLEVESVTPWVEAEGTFQVRFAPSATVPLDARVRVTVHQRLSAPSDGALDDAVAGVVDQGAGTSILQGPLEMPVLLLGDPGEGLVLDLPVRSGPGPDTRVLVPSSGIHPVTLELTDADGGLLWTTDVFMNHLPGSIPSGQDGQPAVTAVQLVTSIESGPALDPAGAVDIGADELAAVSSLQELLGELGSLPLTVALRPNTVEGLRLSGDPADAEFLATATRSNWTFARQSYVRVDATGLAETGGSELARQVAVGDAVVAGSLQRAVEPAIWVLDDTVDPASARLLRDLGVRHLVMSPDRFDVRDPEMERTARVFALEDPEGMTVSSFDVELTRGLLDATADPALVANRLATRLMAGWFDAVAQGAAAFPGVVASIIVPPGTSAETLRALALPLVGDGPLQLRAYPSASGDAGRARLLPREAGDYRGIVARTDEVGAHVDGYRSMTSAEDPEAITWDLVNDQAPALFVDDAERRQMWDGVDAQISQRLAQIEPPRSRTVVLTARTGSIPLRFRNGLDTEVRLRMRTRSARLEFPAGEVTEVVLPPGDTLLKVPVVVRAPGSSLLRIELSSPDGLLNLPDSTVTVRSSSISGVGAGLSVISLCFLAFWWVHTHRRRRRERRAPGV